MPQFQSLLKSKHHRLDEYYGDVKLNYELLNPSEFEYKEKIKEIIDELDWICNEYFKEASKTGDISHMGWLHDKFYDKLSNFNKNSRLMEGMEKGLYAK